MKDEYTTNSHHLTDFSSKGWENVLFELGSERVNVTPFPSQIDWMRYFGGLFAQTPHKITEDLQIVVFGLDYMVKLDELLGRTPKR